MYLRRSIRIVFATMAFVLVLGFEAVAQPKRIALVIGNAEYEHVTNLPNPANDASDIASALKDIGFDVMSGTDLEYNQMRLMIRDFAKAAANADVVLVYFAGHGIEIDNTNYLIPVNALLQSDRDVDFETIPLDKVIKSLSGIDGLKVVLVDACRNNPFLSEMVLTSATRSIGRGLGRIDPGAVLVGYAARSGTLALDGDGRNSPYAQALLQHISEPGLEIGKMFRKVRDTVGKITEGYQQPFTYGSLPADDIFLVPAAAPSAMLGEKLGPVSPEQRLFDAAQSLGTISAWNTFLQRYSDSGLVDEARAARRALVAAISPEGEAPRTELTVPRRNLPATVVSGPLSRANVRAVQQRLNATVFSSKISTDGTMGPQTRRAIMRFQRATGLAPSGAATRSTLNQLSLLKLRPEIGQEPFIISTVPQIFDPEEVASAEPDPRIVKAVTAFADIPMIYGSHEAHAYVALSLEDADLDEVVERARELGGYMASAETRLENWFLFGMVRYSGEFWDEPDGSGVRAGPSIGLRGDRAATWKWDSDARLTFEAWRGIRRPRLSGDTSYARYFAGTGERSGEIGLAPEWGIGGEHSAVILEFE